MSPVHTLKVDNPFNGLVAKQFDPPFDHQQDLTYVCAACRQRVHARDLGQVFHHETPGHRPIPPQEVRSAKRTP